VSRENATAPPWRGAGADLGGVLGELDHAQGRHEDARAALHEALRLFCELDMPAEEAATIRTLEALGDDGSHAHGASRPATTHAVPPTA
jgi:hypothetical protein